MAQQRQVATLTPEGEIAVDFIERFCVQSKGAEGGRLIKPRPWQRQLVLDLLKSDPMTGLRQHRTGLIGVAKKNGKSLLSSTLAAYFLNEDPEPGGEIYSAAAAKDQARIVFDETKKMIEGSLIIFFFIKYILILIFKLCIYIIQLLINNIYHCVYFIAQSGYFKYL